jgi:soluble lytic murein transglycosylase
MRSCWRCTRAYGKNDAKRLSALLPQVRGHVLEPLAAYWEMRVRLDTASESEIRQFLNTYAGSYYEDRLRNDWLLQLGKRRNWATFTAEYPRYRMRDDREVRCYALATEAMNTKADVAEEAKRIWYALREADDGCTYVAEHLHSGGKSTRWTFGAKPASPWTPTGLAPPKRLWTLKHRAPANKSKIHADPSTKYLNKRILAITRNQKELAVLALIRLAASQPDQAAQLLNRQWGSAAECRRAQLDLGRDRQASRTKTAGQRQQPLCQGAKRQRSERRLAVLEGARCPATRSMAAGADRHPGDEPRIAKRPCLGVLARPRPDGHSARHGPATRSTNLLRSIASVRGFYEQLALEESGPAHHRTPSAPSALTPQEKAAALINPGLQRALYAIHWVCAPRATASGTTAPTCTRPAA